MANIDNSEVRQVLHQQVFAPDQERLIFAIPVTPFVDRKRIRYLCLAVGKETAFVYVVKQDRKAFRKKPEAWPVFLLKEINGRSQRGEPSLDFELIFGDQRSKPATYVWSASTVSEKNAFLVQLAKLQRKFADPVQLGQLRFVGLGEDLEDQLARIVLESNASKQELKPAGMPLVSSQHTFVQDKEEMLNITEKEQQDLEKVFELSRQFDYDVDVLMKKLTEEIGQMESANVHDLMNTHNDIENICRLIDQSVDDLNKVDQKITKYHDLVGTVSDQVTMMDETGHKLKVQNKNVKKLITDISAVLSALDFNMTYRVALMDGDLMNKEKLPEIIEAANVLSQVSKAPLPYGFEYHPAVDHEKKRLERLKATFGNRVIQNLTNSFVSYSNNHPPRRDDLILVSHLPMFRTMLPYAKIVRWMKDNLPQMYDSLTKTYTEKLGELYRYEYTDFFEKVRSRITTSAEASNATRLNPEYWLGWDEEIRLQPSDYADYKANLDHFRTVFRQVAKSVTEEQNFLIEFFGLPPENEPPSADADKADGTAIAAGRPNLASQISVYKSDTPLKLRLKELFKNIDEMLIGVVATSDKANKLNNMELLVVIHEILIDMEPQCPFLGKCYGGMMIALKRNFDNYMRDQVSHVLNAKVPKRSRFGPLPFVCNFEHFASFAENIFQGSQRRIDLDRAYYNLLKQGIFEGINRIANHKDCKTPGEVVFLENYHRLSDILSRLKIASLEDIRRDTRQGYNDYRKSYVQAMLGKPLEKVQVFFDGVDAKIQTTGIQPHEVSFTTQFGKAELTKVLAMYPRSVVKKGLEQLYRKVEKQLSDEENLLQVVWRDMQQEFIEQYQNYQRLIEVCYPNSQIVFGFGIDDILKIFEEIAASH
ncbi:exocyst complex component 1-like [Paramacrobiotus metropolitanus]|uniref:exocyst complex component 1-like n=1 Tax=Paramacrobiotus metropolitanus TaxID=2943436 RepID=UPI00244638BC|nr:exocyst complex component 1-like [Paramacrobiotus metropolitanus]XP_055332833.1 exocyst complex component 1-like [Paramacrobiotus metropolitanus]XP_055332834.1 exocyst complex component 1-like [Paramacrobiotus metropolitanus]XP_055332835.1 exocyst complex component 1-like [Paramacrobiotus metropolitanus]XP_055332836.1 exocyst complex component 1-like [Paramacrobiotus metropolitanus]